MKDILYKIPAMPPIASTPKNDGFYVWCWPWCGFGWFYNNYNECYYWGGIVKDN